MCDQVELLSQPDRDTELLTLSLVSSSDIFILHAAAFSIFILTSLISMTLVTYYIKDVRNREFKRNIVTISWCCVFLAAYFYNRHNEYCEPFIYSGFAVCEYLVVGCNMAWHGRVVSQFTGYRLTKDRTIHKLKQTKKGSSSSYYQAPLLDGSTCPLLEVPPNILEIIFSGLSLQELSQLSQACKQFDDQVGEFLRHECHARDLQPTKIYEFLQINRKLLTHLESELFIHGDFVLSKEKDELPRKMMYSVLYLHHCRRLFINCRRVSTTDDSVCFPHRGKNRYIPVRYSDHLDRNIVRVKTACWLQFSHEFRDVSPGRYMVSVQVRVESNLAHGDYESDNATQFIVKYPGADAEVKTMSKNVFRNWWQQLYQNKTPSADISDGVQVTWDETTLKNDQSITSSSPLQSLLYGHEMNNAPRPWVTVTLPEFMLTQPGSVSFELRDAEGGWRKGELFIQLTKLRVENGWWKGGLSFDFIQLTKL